MCVEYYEYFSTIAQQSKMRLGQVPRNVLDKTVKRTMILGHTVCLLVFFSRFTLHLTCIMHAAYQENNKWFDFYWKWNLMQFWKNRNCFKITTNFVNCLKINSGQKHTSFIFFFCKCLSLGINFILQLKNLNHISYYWFVDRDFNFDTANGNLNLYSWLNGSINFKVDKKEKIRNRYNRIPHPALNTKRERDSYN